MDKMAGLSESQLAEITTTTVIRTTAESPDETYIKHIPDLSAELGCFRPDLSPSLAQMLAAV